MHDLQGMFAYLRDLLATGDDSEGDWHVLADLLEQARDSRAADVRAWVALYSGAVRGPAAVAAYRQVRAGQRAAGRHARVVERRSHGFSVEVYRNTPRRDSPRLRRRLSTPRLARGGSIMELLRPWFEAKGSELLTVLDLTSVQPTDTHLEELARAPEMQQIRSLTMGTERMAGPGLHELLRSPRVALRAFQLHGALAGWTVEELARAPWPLRRFGLLGPVLPDAAVEALAQTHQELRQLTLRRLGWQHIPQLIHQLPQLRELTVGLAESQGPAPPEAVELPATLDLTLGLGSQRHFARLATQPWLAAARCLRVPSDGPGLATLVASRHLANVQELELSVPVSAAALMRFLTQVLGLVALSVAAAGEEMGEVLAMHPALSRLERLRLRDGWLSRDAALGLARSKHPMEAMKRLSLVGDPAWRGAPIRSLAERGDLQPTSLRLEGLGLDDGDITRLAASPLLAHVRILWLGGNEIGVRGLKALAASAQLSELEVLGLAGNPVTEEPSAIPILADPGRWPALRVLDVGAAKGTARLRLELADRIPPNVQRRASDDGW
ncbi:MAG: hypothetical protein KTR31_04240 [Myxococcales bacterium]|nr:hypothetical protein [Myxococcales bacterium]